MVTWVKNLTAMCDVEIHLHSKTGGVAASCKQQSEKKKS